jgi:RNA polymerase sigma factor (sigma-70 family)
MAIDERELDDAALVDAAKAGDDTAFAELFRRHYPTVRRACARRLGSTVDADEVAQAAFVRAYERIGQCAGERRFGAWVQVIAFNLGSDARRLNARATPVDDPVTLDFLDDSVVSVNLCEEHVLRAEQAAALSEVLAELPPRQREVIIARDVEGRRPTEIAASLGLSIGAVDSLLLRARRRMADLWRLSGAERGAATVPMTTASLAATTAVMHSSALTRVAATVQRVAASGSYRVAQLVGVVPARHIGLTRLTGIATVSAIAAAPAAVMVPTAHHPATQTNLAPHVWRAVPDVVHVLRHVATLVPDVGAPERPEQMVAHVLTAVAHPLVVPHHAPPAPTIHPPAQQLPLITVILRDLGTVLGRRVGG